MPRVILALFCFAFMQTLNAQAPQLRTHTNEEVIAAMTTEEKVRLLVGMGMDLSDFIPEGEAEETEAPSENTARKVRGAAGSTSAIPRLGIPSLILADGPAGLRIAPERPGTKETFYATAFPIASLQAASWDEELVSRVGRAMGAEAKAYGIDIILAPGMNIQRNAMGGRNFEYYSEDPLLSGTMAASLVRGIQSEGIGTAIKHFAANNHETNRYGMNVKADARTLREIYLRGFEIAVKRGRPWTVMSSYNKINGTYTSESAELLRDVLRNDWGFDGFVMTDWGGGQDPVAQVKAGNNLLMPGNEQQYNALLEATTSGELPERMLDENVDDVLRIIRRSFAFSGEPVSNQPNLRRNASTALRAATDGMVLLKNDKQTLPLGRMASVAAFGNYSYDLISGGTGSGDVNEAYTKSIVDGMNSIRYTVDQKLNEQYTEYLKEQKAKLPKKRNFLQPQPQIPELELSSSTIRQAAQRNDVAVLTIGRISGEVKDRETEGDFYLTAGEKKMIQEVAKAFHAANKKVVVVLNVGGPVEMVSWRDQVDAILLAWLPGQEGGMAITSLFMGKAVPSGKLPITFPVRFEDDPTAEGFPGREYGEKVERGFFSYVPSDITYDEGVFVGYRAFDKEDIKPAYEFGYGLSYTEFEYSNMEVIAPPYPGKDADLRMSITNTGEARGREVVQLYVSAPGKERSTPEKELKGFKKTRLLNPGETQKLAFSLPMHYLASFDSKRSIWVVEPGVYTLRAGASSRDIRLEKTLKIPEEIIVDDVNQVLLMED